MVQKLYEEVAGEAMCNPDGRTDSLVRGHNKIFKGPQL